MGMDDNLDDMMGQVLTDMAVATGKFYFQIDTILLSAKSNNMKNPQLEYIHSMSSFH